MSDNNKIDKTLEDEINVIRTLVSLGRAARNRVNMKTRQPLSELVYKLSQDKKLSEDNKQIILEELNIKKMKRLDENEFNEMLTFGITPNFTTLGPKFGNSVNAVTDWIKSMTQEEIQKFYKLGTAREKVDGVEFEITKQDVEVKQIAKQGWSIAIEDDFAVGVNTELTSELENEGLVRELIHKIQLMRKKADFNLVDRIKIFYQTTPKLKEAIHAHLDYLKNETLAVEVTEGSPEADATEVLNINGIEAEVTLQKINMA
jgi:isoleucyl-tRNA synthetase